jgi:hypothetical protein
VMGLPSTGAPPKTARARTTTTKARYRFIGVSPVEAGKGQGGVYTRFGRLTGGARERVNAR